jgi:hypothetical protein
VSKIEERFDAAVLAGSAVRGPFSVPAAIKSATQVTEAQFESAMSAMLRSLGLLGAEASRLHYEQPLRVALDDLGFEIVP